MPSPSGPGTTELKQDHETTSTPEPAPKNEAHKRRWAWKWRLLVSVLVLIVALGALEAIPGFPGHAQASLLGDLAASNVSAGARKVIPFLRESSNEPCTRIESNFEVGNHLLRDNEIGWYASIWPSYQALTAFYLGSLLSDNGSCRRNFESNLTAINTHYWDDSYQGSPAAFDQGPAAFHLHSNLPRVDDSLWMGLAELTGYQMSGNEAFLQRAKAVFRLAIGNWDPKQGGIYWEYHAPGAKDFDKSVVSNAPAVVLGAALFAKTGKQSYLTWSGRILAWLENNLRDPTTGLYNDHIDDQTSSPTIDEAKLTYNQGIMIGAMTAMDMVDPAQYPLSSAVDLADRAMAYFQAHHSYGHPDFDAIWASNLLWIASLYKSPAFARNASSSIELAIRAEPNPSDSLLTNSAEAALHDLQKLPAYRYAELSYLPSRSR